MLFFSNFRTFSRLAKEFEERIAQLETRNAALRRDLAELDEFTHRISRKRYQETYTPPAEGQTEAQPVLPLEGSVVGLKANKAELWERVRKAGGK